MPHQLIIFAKEPLAGQVKTRLIPALGPEGALKIYQLLAQRVFTAASQLAQQEAIALEIAYGGQQPGLLALWAGEGFCFTPQSAGDLGQRMSSQFQRAFTAGANKVVLVGTDIPDLSAEILSQAFQALDQSPFTLGPCVDGGYYLIGLARPVPSLFHDIPWSTPKVCQLTLERAKDLDLHPVLLPTLRDIDEPPDLRFYPQLVLS